jgi:hypothetical protein
VAPECLDAECGEKNPRETSFLVALCKNGALVVPSSEGSRMSLHFYTIKCVMGGVWPIPQMPSRHPSYCPDSKILVYFKDANLFRNHAFLSPNFSNLSILAFAPDSHYKP